MKLEFNVVKITRDAGLLADALKMRINDKNEVEVAALRGKKIELLYENGKLLRFNEYDKHDEAFWDSFVYKGKQLFDEPRKRHYDIEGWVFSEIIQTGP